MPLLFLFRIPPTYFGVLSNFQARFFFHSLYAFYFLLSLVAPFLSFQPIFTQNPLLLNLNYNNFLRLIKP